MFLKGDLSASETTTFGRGSLIAKQPIKESAIAAPASKQIADAQADCINFFLIFICLSNVGNHPWFALRFIGIPLSEIRLPVSQL